MSQQHDQPGVGSRVLYENEWVRVWELELGPGETFPRHHHTLKYVTVALGEADLEAHEIDGTVHRNHRTLGDIQVTDVAAGQIHELRNVGKTAYRNRIIEFKTG